jgi:hypothetical protein
MTSDLTIVSNRAAQTLPGADSSTVYVKRSESADTIERGVQATALTYPRTITIVQQARNPGTRKGSQRTVVIAKERDASTVVALESGLGGRADGEATVTLTIVRPTAPGYQTTFTAAKLKTLIGVVFDSVLQNADALIAGEK